MTLVALAWPLLVAIAILLATFWSLRRVGGRGWRSSLWIGVLAGAAFGVLYGTVTVASSPWSLFAVCAAAGAVGCSLSLALSGAYRAPVGAVLIACLVWSSARFVPDAWIYANEFRDASDVIRLIEDFRKTKGRLPANLAEIGRSDDESGPLFYNVWSHDHYFVSFSAPRYGFFGDLSYDSEERVWTGGD